MLATRMKQAASSGAEAVFAFDSSLVTFTAGMGKRNGGGPFAAGVMGQGDWATANGGSDTVTISRGTQISSNFYANWDSGQGFWQAWITPEWDGDDGVEHVFAQWSSNGFVRKTSGDNLELSAASGVSVTVDISSWTAGTTYHVFARWDSRNDLDATNYLCLSINDSHTFGYASSYTAEAPAATIYFGSDDSGQNPANASAEGMTWGRIPHYDGSYGINIDNGDVINETYSSGSGEDVTLTTGSWDCNGCQPTNATVEALTSGTGEAWSHPHSSAILTDTFCETTYGSSAWATEGTPSTGPADTSDLEQIFAWGYKWTADATDEGIKQSLTGLTAGEDYILRCLAHTDTADDIKIQIYDDTNGAETTSFEFGASSNRAAPGVAVFAWELPTIARNGTASDCTAMTVKIMSTAASQTVYLHQCEMQENLIDNPSMETGSGDPWIPNGWTTGGLDSGDSEEELTIIHSGGSATQFNPSTSYESIRQNGIFSADNFFGCGIWANGSAGNIRFNSGGLSKTNDGQSLIIYHTFSSSWEPVLGVMRGIGADSFAIQPYNSPVGYVDDAYLYQLDDVSLTVTPASEANSTETTGLRVDGLDTLTQPVTELTATSGTIEAQFTPRLAAADWLKVGQTSQYLFDLYEDANNYLSAYISAANTITLAYNANGGGAQSDTWDATGAWDAGNQKTVTVNYGAANCTLAVAGVTKITIAGVVAFAGAPSVVINWGHDQTGGNQFDGTIDAP